jgi:2-oxo-3-hexenedioate decarboxylase
MCDDTVTMAAGNRATMSLQRMCSPRLEPEIVFTLREPIGAGESDPEAALPPVEWLALGFEIVDSIFADWPFQPADFVAAYGLHTALIVGDPHPVDPARITEFVEPLSAFRVRLLRNESQVAEGSGRNCLRSPALCLGVLAVAIAKRIPDVPLATGELVSTGTLTEPQPMALGRRGRPAWRACHWPICTLRTT